MASYDLRYESWIPVEFIGGGSGAVGLHDALVRAHEIREIGGDSPVEAIALNRLLLALAIRTHPETESEDGWFERWDAGSLDPAAINSYLEKWGDRFDLFHPEHPFYQVRTNTGNSVLAVSMLRIHECGNVPELYSHVNLRSGETMSPAEAAVGVVASQFATSGGLLSNPFKTGNKNTPFMGSAVFWLRGRSLFEALMLNAPPTSLFRMGGSQLNVDDAPAWEVEPSAGQSERASRGILDFLTFQHRRLTLLLGDDGESDAVVVGLRRTGGDHASPRPLDEPHIAVLEESKTRPRGPYAMRPDRALWRDSSIFMTLLKDGGSKAPLAFQWVSDHTAQLHTDRFLVDVFGMRTRGANDGTFLFWRRESMPLFTRTLTDPTIGQTVMQLLERAEKQREHLRAAIYTVARLVVPSTEEVAKFTTALDAEGRYWGVLEAPFYDAVRQVVEGGERNEVLRSWTAHLHRTAFAAFDSATSSLDGSGRQLQAVAVGRRQLRPAARYSIPAVPPSTHASTLETLQ